MAARPTVEPELDLTLLPQILKAIRRRRDMGVAEVAKAMGIAPRTYSNFEAGRGQLSVPKIHQFAEIVGADPYAILIALDIKSPSFALRCMDHQFMAMLVLQIQDFDSRVQDSFTRIDPRILFALTRQFFDSLVEQSEEVDASLERWMLDRSLHETPAPEDPADQEPDGDDPEKDRG
jgi:transcriptional regulator with XRE-family HTH domain